MSQAAVIRIPESQVLLLDGEFDTRFNGCIVALFLNKSNFELTRKNYLSNLRQFILFSGKKDILEVRVEDVLAWRDSMERKGFAPHTIETKLATLSALFEYSRLFRQLPLFPAHTVSLTICPSVKCRA